MTSLHADEAFLGHYQFSHDPFAPRVPGFKFFPAQRKPVLGQLHHLARYSQLLLLVTGPLGSGKTLLRQALVASTNKDAVLSVVISARTAADETSLLRQVAQGLSINQASLEAILTKVAQLAITGQDVYLMVDDAEQLQDSALEVLLLLASGTNEGRLHVFLFGEPSLLPRLEVFSEGEERFHAIELQPYSEEETRDYLAQRLEGAGQGIELISNDLLVDIHEQSEGWPGAINQVARDALIEAMLANRGAARKATGGSFNLPKKHLVILAVVAIGVIAAWFMQGKSKPEAPQTASTELSMNGATPAQAQQPGSGPAVEFNGSSQPLPLPLVGESQPVIREPLAQAAGQGGDDEGGLPSAAVPPTVSSSAPPVTPLLASGGGAGSQWYRNQSGGNFALQILGTGSEANAQAFIRQQGGGDFRYFKKTLQGKPFYVVTYGSFPNRAAALAAVKKLPSKVQAGKPWPRTFASIQQEIGQAH
ncbi:SPOR domain-containing protein [Pseudomonas aeruginosa]|uniref:SPOR domain-containing protein n=2 Tax=Pseudomonas aeruginosa TaxID=287 RepID=UPI000BD395D4|nr:AAA family ATPase [Pseudomonas aeruginosa]PCN31401.1 cell division protein [Pseudomonas aeruginosa]